MEENKTTRTLEENKSTRTLEENFEEIEEILQVLSTEDISLEEAFGAYKNGMEILKTCNEQIDQVEKKVLMLNADAKLEEY